MEFTDAVRARRMVRSFDPERGVDRDTLRIMLNLAIRAPSAGHTQGWRFLVLDDITSRDLFWSSTSDGPLDAWRQRMGSAPVLVVCYCDPEAYLDRYAEPDKGWRDRSLERWPIPYWHVDVGMAAMTLLLSAVDLGLGACFFGVPAERWPSLAAAFGMPERLQPVGVVALGHPAPDDRSRPLTRRGRRPFEEVVQFGGQPPPD